MRHTIHDPTLSMVSLQLLMSQSICQTRCLWSHGVYRSLGACVGACTERGINCPHFMHNECDRLESEWREVTWHRCAHETCHMHTCKTGWALILIEWIVVVPARPENADLWSMWEDERVCHKHLLPDRSKSNHMMLHRMPTAYTRHEVGCDRFR